MPLCPRCESELDLILESTTRQALFCTSCKAALINTESSSDFIDWRRRV